MNRTEFESAIKKAHPRCAVVAMRSGGSVYLRPPTDEEYDTFQALTDGGSADEKRTAFKRYVQGCFVGAIVGDETIKELKLSEVAALEGPAFVANGAMGHAVNKLAGAEPAATRFL